MTSEDSDSSEKSAPPGTAHEAAQSERERLRQILKWIVLITTAFLNSAGIAEKLLALFGWLS
jgi:hypothetical protein